MINKLREMWETLHPRSFTVGLRKQRPDIYKWANEQLLPVEVKSFTDRAYVLLNPAQPKCANVDCNNLVTTLTRTGWGIYCSIQCKCKYNSLTSRSKAVTTSNKNWGVDNPAQHHLVRDMMKATMKVNHGVEYAKQSKEILDKTEVTMLERYQVKYAAQSPIIQAEMKVYWLEKYGVDNPAKRHISQDTFDKLDDPAWLSEQNLIYSFGPLADQLGISIPTLSLAFRRHKLVPVTHNIVVSDAERSIVDFIKANSDTTVIESDRTVIGPFELDIYLPDLNTAIEFNGNYWHSELNGKDSQYHLNKTIKCMDKGIHLIHIWEYIYNQKTAIVQSKLNNLLGNSQSIYGRKCTIKEIDNITARKFLDTTHIQGYCASTIRLGLYEGGNLVAVMTFGNSRYNSNYEYELLRYCSALGKSVVGGFSKLLSHFIKTYDPASMVSYSDLTWSIGKVYTTNGFILSHRAKPSYYYTRDYVNFEHRMAFQKKKMATKLPNFDVNLSEWQNMQTHDYDRIWNCGNDVWVWNKQLLVDITIPT